MLVGLFSSCGPLLQAHYLCILTLKLLSVLSAKSHFLEPRCCSKHKLCHCS